MDYLVNKQNVDVGEILKVYVGKKFEGWARLLEPYGEPFSYIDNNAVYVSEKWKVEFVTPEEIPGKPTDKEKFNQKFVQGFRTHRSFSYFAALSWDKYVAMYGNPKEGKKSMEFLKRKDDNEIF